MRISGSTATATGVWQPAGAFAYDGGNVTSGAIVITETKFTAETFNRMGADCLPGHLGVQITRVGKGELAARLPLQQHLLAPNGFLHAASVIALADTAAGCACLANLPEGANNFTTIELKSNHLGTARDGVIECVATAVHLGRTTQVWDAVVTDAANGKTIALFRCTQMILYPK
jgi:1,4-dihydroxy-2-naphthoyl-CoA hydrolase